MAVKRAMFDDRLIDDVRARTRLAILVGETVALKKRGREYLGLCPFHGERTPSFTVNEDKAFITVSAAVRMATRSAG